MYILFLIYIVLHYTTTCGYSERMSILIYVILNHFTHVAIFLNLVFFFFIRLLCLTFINKEE